MTSDRIVTDWSTLLATKADKALVKSFVDGNSIRSIVGGLSSAEAKTEAYRLEKHVPANVARSRARKALRRYQ